MKNRIMKRPHRRTRIKDKGYKFFSQLAYQDKTEDAEQELLSKTPDTKWRIDKELSSRNQKVFVNPYTKRVVIAYRGTDPTNWNDIKSDVAIATGTQHLNKRFQNTLNHFNTVQDKYKHYQYHTTGHSLGGSLAEYVNRKNPGKVTRNVNFNRGGGFGTLFERQRKNTTDYVNVFDPVSLAVQRQRHSGETRYGLGTLRARNMVNMVKNSLLKKEAEETFVPEGVIGELYGEIAPYITAGKLALDQHSLDNINANENDYMTGYNNNSVNFV